jgi:putative transposase
MQQNCLLMALSEQMRLIEVSRLLGWAGPMPRRTKPVGPVRNFKASSEVIRMTVLLYVRFPLSLPNVEDLLFERGITNNGAIEKSGGRTACAAQRQVAISPDSTPCSVQS